jgi:hypothetical protein
MSETVKAADLNLNHLGRKVRVSQGDAEFIDTLSGVSHEADLVYERKVCEEVGRFVLGRIATKLTFATAGSVQVNGNADVQIDTPRN